MRQPTKCEKLEVGSEDTGGLFIHAHVYAVRTAHKYVGLSREETWQSSRRPDHRSQIGSPHRRTPIIPFLGELGHRDYADRPGRRKLEHGVGRSALPHDHEDCQLISISSGRVAARGEGVMPDRSVTLLFRSAHGAIYKNRNGSPSPALFLSHNTMSQPVVATVRVKPSTGLGLARPDPVKIHTVDLVVPLVWAPIYYFFPPVSQAEHPVKETILNLISSLADVLEHFPLLVGSFKRDEAGDLYIHSDNVGSDFVYELRNERFPGQHAQGLDPRNIEFGLPPPGDPLIAVKFTAVREPIHVALRLYRSLMMRHSSHAERMFCASPLTTQSVTCPR